MTDAEIKKALEELLEMMLHEGDSQRASTISKTLDLINRQKAEIERLQKLQKPTGAGGFKIENGKVIYYSDMLNGYRHEFKDLDEIVKELNLYMHTDYKNIELISHYKHKAQNAKAEAYEDLAEKLKAKKQRLFSETDGFLWCVSAEDIDEVLNEVSSGDNTKVRPIPIRSDITLGGDIDI